MTEEFQHFDTAPILPVVRISRWNFSLREIVLAIVAGVLLLLCLILSGILGKMNEKLANVPSAAATVDKQYCTDIGCLKTATRALSLMNTSVDPCENFYQFACGNYRQTKRFVPFAGGSNVLSDLTEENDDRIIEILEQQPTYDFPAEQKLKDFFSLCKNMLMREKARGAPLLDDVLPELGGWKVLGTWDANWDLNEALKKVQSDFWVRAFYEPRVEYNKDDGGRRIISLRAGGVGHDIELLYWLETEITWFKMKGSLPLYKNFVRTTGELLVDDARKFSHQVNFSLTKDLLVEFANDTSNLESYIVTLDKGEDYTRMTLDNFTSQTNNTIDWTGQLSYMFNQSGVSGSTVVEIRNLQYFKDLSVYLQSLPEKDKKRILHNYFIWRVLDNYRKMLSWDYLHADDGLLYEYYHRDMPALINRNCFHLTERYMQDALNHLYITQFLSVENKQTAHDITDSIRLALKTQISKTPWMDLPTRQKAQEKLDGITLKIGYPDWMANRTEINMMYSSLDVDRKSFFNTVLNMNQLQRNLWNTDLQRIGPDYVDWEHPVYSTKSSPNVEHHEMDISAGFLQFPIYDAVQPHSSSFGSLGAIVGKNLHKFVDGGQESWWSNSTKDQYKLVEQCVQHVYSNIIARMDYVFGEYLSILVDPSEAAPIAINWISGIRLALLGYQDWTKKKALDEKIIQGLEMTHSQMIFLTHTQAHCETSDGFFYEYAGMSAEKNMNMALGQLDEFSHAFQCNKTASMNHAKKCQYY